MKNILEFNYLQLFYNTNFIFQSPHNESQDVVAKLRSKYESLLLRSPEALSAASEVGEDSLVPGQMLLMGFNGLFEKLQLEGNALIAALDTLDTPLSWKKVDQVREAKAMSVSIITTLLDSV